MTRIVVTDHVFDDLDLTRASLLPLGVEVVEAPSTDEATLVELVRDAAAVITCYAPVTGAVVQARKSVV